MAQAATDKFMRFLGQDRRQRLVNGIGLGFAGLLMCFLVMLISGDYFSGILRAMGIEGVWTQQGIYTDCSKPENRKIRYCQPKESVVDRDWKNLRASGKAAPFSLSDR